jgi:hypothetical protein
MLGYENIPFPLFTPPNKGAAYSASGTIFGFSRHASGYTPGINILHFPAPKCYMT